MVRLKHDPMYDERSTKVADAAKSCPTWDREALILKIQIIDSCTRREAGRQVDQMAHSFIHHLEDPPTAPVYVRHRTECSRLSGWLPRANLLPILEHGRS
jgi:hypothetical protein